MLEAQYIRAVKAEISNSIAKAGELLSRGEVVAIPTETVYGLAANALNQESVLKIFSIKNRPHFDPLIVHVASLEHASAWVKEIPLPAQKLAARYWPGPLTLLLKKKQVIPDIVTSGLDTVGIRVPAHPLTLELLRSLDFPLAAPSANPFGYISPTTSQHVIQQLGNQIPLILEGGSCEVGVESTIVDFTTAIPTIVRLGGLSVEHIQEVLGDVHVNITSSSKPSSPGMLISHYAPRKPFYLGNLEELRSIHRTKKLAEIAFSGKESSSLHRVLSVEGKMEEAAFNLFKIMRELDESDADAIIAQPVPEVGLGRAINDRMRRAAAH